MAEVVVQRGVAGRRKDGRAVQLTERDELIVRWIVRHGLVTSEHLIDVRVRRVDRT